MQQLRVVIGRLSVWPLPLWLGLKVFSAASAQTHANALLQRCSSSSSSRSSSSSSSAGAQRGCRSEFGGRFGSDGWRDGGRARRAVAVAAVLS